MIEFRLLGALHLTDAAGREVKSLLTRSRRLALLAYLAATPQRFHRRDSLLVLFWPELDQEHARAALRQALHVLRGALGPDVVVTRGDEEIGLDRDHLWCDVAAFEDAMGREQFDQALELYRGNLLDGFFIPGAAEFERWVESERARLRQAAGRAAQALVQRCVAAGDLPAALEWARRAVRLGPHAEEPLRELVTLLDQLGDRAGAVAAYEEFARQLGLDLEAEPAAETKALLSAVRARETAAPVELRTPAPRGVSAAPASPPRRRLLWGSLVAVAGVTLLVTLAVGGAGRRSGSGAPGGRVPALAVLPLENLSGDAIQDAFVDGMTTALITDLGGVRALRVVSRRASTRFKGSPLSARQIGESLGVGALVEGGLQRSEDRLRVDLQLIDVATGNQLWAHHFEDRLQNRFTLQDAMSRGVLSALSLPVTPAEARQLRTPPTANLEAYDAFLRGKIRLRHETRKDDSVAITLLEKATALDPDFAVAQATLAYAYSFRVAEFVPDDTASLEKGLVAVEKAMRLNPDLPEAHLARAHLLWGGTHQFAHAQAIQEDRRALSLNANLDDAHHHLGYIYLHLGLLDQAIDEFRKTLAIDPGNWIAQQRIGVALINEGRYDEALRTLRQVPDSVSPRLWHYHVAWTLLYLGRTGEAAALIERYLRAHPGDPGGLVTSVRAILRAKTGDASGAEQDIRAAVEKGKGYVHFHHAAYNIAAAYALLHRPPAAVPWLRRAAETGLPAYPLFAQDPNLDNIRGDANFTAFMRDLKAQWERYRATL